MISSRSVSIKGHNISYSEKPGSRGAICFIHGNSSSSQIFSEVFAAKELQDNRLFTFDFPGHGNSDHLSEAETYSIPFYADVLATFSEKFIATPSIYVGHSLGGHILLEAAENLPSAIGLVLLGTPPVSNAASLEQAYLPCPEFGCFFKGKISNKELKELLAVVGVSNLVHQNLILDSIKKTDPRARDNLAQTVGQNLFKNEVEVARGLKVPLAIAAGENDPFIHRDYVLDLGLPTLWKSRICDIPTAGHYPQLDAPRQLARLLKDFYLECSA